MFTLFYQAGHQVGRLEEMRMILWSGNGDSKYSHILIINTHSFIHIFKEKMVLVLKIQLKSWKIHLRDKNRPLVMMDRLGVMMAY